MTTRSSSFIARMALIPSVSLLLVWMLVPLLLALYFSTLHYDMLSPGEEFFIGFENYQYILTDPAFTTALVNTFFIVSGVLIITIVGGLGLALLLLKPVFATNAARLLVIAPFFIMPAVSALVWKTLLMHPVSGFFAWILAGFGMPAIDWFGSIPLTSIIIIVAWQWLPFAMLVLLTALQSLDKDQMDAARLDGASGVQLLRWVILPHLSRAISIVILIETMFLLTIFAEILVTTNGGPGLATTNIAYLIYSEALLQFNVGSASAGGIIAVVLANIVAFALIRLIGKEL